MRFFCGLINGMAALILTLLGLVAAGVCLLAGFLLLVGLVSLGLTEALRRWLGHERKGEGE